MTPRSFVPAFAGALVLFSGSLASAEEKKLGWADVAELSYVATSGNAEAETLGFHNKLSYTWANALFTLEAGGLRAETTTRNLFVISRPGGGGAVVVEDENTARTAENYLLRARYERNLSAQLYGFAGAGWERNEFAGFEGRSSAVLGVGWAWFDRDDAKFKTDLGATYTSQKNLVSPRGVSPQRTATDDFAGLRVSWDYLRQLTTNTTFTHTVALDQNLDDTDDLRADMVNSVAVAMSSRLALKVSHQLLYDHQPAVIQVPFLGSPPSRGTLPYELDDVDTKLTVALVVNF